MKIIKKISAVMLLLAMTVTSLSLSSCGGDGGIDQIAWDEYDLLIEQIKQDSNASRREDLLHRAETMLMSTECIAPLYNYCDIYMLKSRVSGMYSNAFGAKYFQGASVAGKDSLSLDLGNSPDSIDPALAESVSELTIVANTFSGLYTYASDGTVMQDLAAECKASEDGLIYTFTLKTGLKWSDGSSLGASDFVYSWRRAADDDTGSPYAYLFDVIARDEKNRLILEADETDTILTVTLSSPCDYFMDLCAFPAFYPVPEMKVEYADGYMDKYGNILDADAWTIKSGYPTSGAYYVSSRNDDMIVLSKNKHYHKNSDVAVSSIEIRVGTDAEASYDLYRADELDYLASVPISERESLKNDPELHVDEINSVYYLCFNYNSSMFNGLSSSDAAKLRRLISLYIDREYIVSEITGNGETAATALIPKNISDGTGGLFRANDRDHHYKDLESCGFFSVSTEKNREKALKLMSELGMDEDSDGVLDPQYRTTLTYLTTKNTVSIMIAQAIEQDLSEIGLIVKINAVDEGIFEDEQKISSYDIVAERAVAYYDDALSILEHWVIGAERNYAGLGKEIVIENENAY